MKTTASRLYQYAGENKSVDARPNTSLAGSSYGTQQIKVHDIFTRPTIMSELHKGYGSMKQQNFSQSSRDKFKDLVESRGFQTSKNFDKALLDPEPQFKSIVHEIENFHKPMVQERIKDPHEPNRPRYARRGDPQVGKPGNHKLQAFQAFEAGKISEDQFRDYVGEKDFTRVVPLLKNSEDGRYTQAARELLIDQDARNMINTNPVRNSMEVFSQIDPPAYSNLKFDKGNDSGPMTVNHLDRLAEEESNRKTHYMVYNESKGKGLADNTAKENSGDIIRWTSIGRAANFEADRYAHTRKLDSRAKEQMSQSQWSRDLVKPAPRNRRDFVGNGNIISWM